MNELQEFHEIGAPPMRLVPVDAALIERLPAFKLAGTWRFRRSDLDKWIAANLTNKDSGAGG